jgi:hypothetical protein
VDRIDGAFRVSFDPYHHARAPTRWYNPDIKQASVGDGALIRNNRLSDRMCFPTGSSAEISRTRTVPTTRRDACRQWERDRSGVCSHGCPTSK